MPTAILPASQQLLALARRIDSERARKQESRLGEPSNPLARAAAVLLSTAYPATTRQLEADPTLAPLPLPLDRAALNRELATLVACTEADFCRGLRRVASRERLRIALRETLPPELGGAELRDTARELSDLADATIGAALEVAKNRVFEALGTPRNAEGQLGRLTVIGMGKLGGRELNPGSDVDLVCIYDSDECTAQSPDRGEQDAHTVWSRVVQMMTALLDDVTEHGFVWRVDLRLRPEGSRGALVNSLAAAERYYETFGRLWERAAWLRARPVAGDLPLGDELLATLAPFIWRRRIEPALATSLYELGERARAELSPEGRRDLKHAPGGIREAELFVQALQLIWGGQNPRIRARSLLTAVERLESAGLVTHHEARDVAAAYVALRRTEHAVQHSQGIQTHALPTQPDQATRLARAIGLADERTLVAHLDRHCSRVHALVQSLLPAAPRAASRWNEVFAALDRHDPPRFARALREAGMPEADPAQQGDLARDLYELSALHPDGLLGARSRERHRPMVETLLEAVAGCADVAQAAHYLRRFASRLPHPDLYTEWLAANAAAVYRLITVLGGSAFVGEAVASRPELADLVLFEPTAATPAQAREEVTQSVRRMQTGSAPDDERLVGALRSAKQRATARIALADLRSEISVREATLALSAVADTTLELTVRLATGSARPGPVRGLAIIAMGKLGGREIGYGSDLDVVFIHAQDTPGDDPQASYSRMARRIIRLITMPHPDGRGYQIDTRLRPSGSQGLLVVSLPAFARYHQVALDSDSSPAGDEPGGGRAATWERLALLRARFCAGDAELGTRAIAVAQRAAYLATTHRETLARDIHRLRQRMARELAHERPGRYDFKVGRGGLMEIELATQFLQLAHGADARVRTTETRAAIEALAGVGAITSPTAAALGDGYGFLRMLEQRVRIVHGDSSQLIEDGAAGLAPLARRMGLVDGAGATAGERLIARYRAVTTRVHSAYQRLVVDEIRPVDGH